MCGYNEQRFTLPLFQIALLSFKETDQCLGHSGYKNTISCTACLVQHKVFLKPNFNVIVISVGLLLLNNTVLQMGWVNIFCRNPEQKY